MDIVSPPGRSAQARLPGVLGVELTTILEERVIYLEIAPGSHLTEQQVCDEFGISRSPVREAFRQLEAAGLVVRYARRGVRVKPMTQDDLDEIFACRLPLEALAAALAAKNASIADINALAKLLDSMKAALDRDDVRSFFDTNVAFFLKVHQSANNTMLAYLLSVVGKQALRYRYFAHTKARDMLNFSYDGLKSIYEAIRSRDGARATRAATAVICEAHRRVHDALDQHGNVIDIPAPLDKEGVRPQDTPETGP